MLVHMMRGRGTVFRLSRWRVTGPGLKQHFGNPTACKIHVHCIIVHMNKMKGILNRIYKLYTIGLLSWLEHGFQRATTKKVARGIQLVITLNCEIIMSLGMKFSIFFSPSELHESIEKGLVRLLLPSPFKR